MSSRDGRTERRTETREARLEIKPSSSARELEGYMAIFGMRSRIPDHAGDFDEEIHPGSFARSLRTNGLPVMQFDHGRDPRVGTVPIGRWRSIEEDGKGYKVSGTLFDNPIVEPVRQALADGALDGMSFRFSVAKNGDKWERRSAGTDLRVIRDADLVEAGPVVFPAYRHAKIQLRAVGTPGRVQRNYDTGLGLDAIMDFIGSQSGLTAQRAEDQADLVREQQDLFKRSVEAERLDIARAFRESRRRADHSYRCWAWYGHEQRDMDDYYREDSAARGHLAALKIACLDDEELVAQIRRRVGA